MRFLSPTPIFFKNPFPICQNIPPVPRPPESVSKCFPYLHKPLTFILTALITARGKYNYACIMYKYELRLNLSWTGNYFLQYISQSLLSFTTMRGISLFTCLLIKLQAVEDLWAWPRVISTTTSSALLRATRRDLTLNLWRCLTEGDYIMRTLAGAHTQINSRRGF